MALLDDVDSEDEGTDPATEKPIDLTPFCRIHSELLMLFHQHWLKEEYTVMRTSSPSSSYESRRDERLIRVNRI